MTNLVDAWVSHTSDGWMLDAYVADSSDPVGNSERLASERFATLDDAYRHAVKTFRYRLVSLSVRVPT